MVLTQVRALTDHNAITPCPSVPVFFSTRTFSAEKHNSHTSEKKMESAKYTISVPLRK